MAGGHGDQSPILSYAGRIEVVLVVVDGRVGGGSSPARGPCHRPAQLGACAVEAGDRRRLGTSCRTTLREDRVPEPRQGLPDELDGLSRRGRCRCWRRPAPR